MGRGKIEIKKIENSTSRQVTFSKRRGGLLKKARELAILCDVQIGLIIFSNSGKMFEFSNPDSSMAEIIERYKRISGSLIDEHSHEQAMYSEITRMQHENEKLLLHLRQLTGEDLSALNLDDLDRLESQLEISVNNVKNRKHQLIHQQSENLRRKVQHLEDENRQLSYMMQENQHAAVTDLSAAGRITDMQVFGQYGFFPDEPKNNMLHFHNLNLQPTQSNLHDQDIHGHDLQL